MKQWIHEDWEFTLTVAAGSADGCRLGLEQGDCFVCRYGTPGGFCPKTMPVLHTLCEIIRCGGSFELRGSDKANEIDFPCADGVIRFHLIARPVR